MATVKRQDGPRGPRWQVRYRDPQNRQKARNFDRAGDAREFAAKVENDRRAGSYIDPAGPRTPLVDLVGRYQATAKHGPATAATRDSDLRNWIVPTLGAHTRIGRISELELQHLLDRLNDRLAPATVERVWAWVTGLFAAAMRARLLTDNPTAGLAPPKAPKPMVSPLEGDQVEAVIACLPAWYRLAGYLAADAGLRVSETAGLATGRVGLRQLHSGLLMVERQLVSLGGIPLHLALPKRGRSRAVPIPESLGDTIAEHLARFPRRPAVTDRVSGEEKVELVLATRYHTPARRQAIDAAFAAAVTRAGLPAGTRFHDLRHYYASVLIDAGCSERELGIRLGHSSAEVTARYGHLFKAADDRTRQAVTNAIQTRRAASAFN